MRPDASSVWPRPGVRLGKARGQTNRFPIRRNRVVETLLGPQHRGEAEVRDVVAPCDRQRPPEHGFAVAPVLHLLPRERGFKRQDEANRQCDHPCDGGAPADDLRATPGHHDAYAGHRQVCVTIGTRLRSRLDESKDWQQRDEIPEPSDKQIRRLPTRVYHVSRDAHEDDGRNRSLTDRGDTGVRVDGRQPAGPRHLHEVEHWRDERVGDPCVDRG